MEATAKAPVAVASSSTSTTNNNAINIHHPTSNTINVPLQPSVWLGNSTVGSNNLTGFLQNRPIKPTSDPTTPKTPENNETNKTTNNVDVKDQKDTGFVFPSRIHRNSGEQIPPSPPNTQYLQNTQNQPKLQYPQNSQHPQNIQFTQNAQLQMQYLQNAQNTHTLQYTQNARNIQNMTSMQIMQSTQHLQNFLQRMQNPQNAPNAQNAQYSQIVKNMLQPQHLQNPQNVQNSQMKYPQTTQNLSQPQQMSKTQNTQQNTQNRQVPQNAQNVPNARQNPPRTETRNAQNPEDEEPMPESPLKRVVVSGYPNYTQAHDILEVFTKFGHVRIDRCNSTSATLTYASEEQAHSAMEASKRLHIYGHFLSVKPCAAKGTTDDQPRSPKREFVKTKQKSVIIEPSKINLSGDFHAQLDLILATIRLNQEDINKISTLYSDLENTFQAHWPGCKAIPFGSITTGLGIKTSDADCFISLPVQFRNPNANHVVKARRLLTQQPHIFTEILAIPRANTPIVKFYHVPTDINCDLTFKTPLGAQNSRLITFLLQADPRITPVAVMIKYWAKVHDLSGTGKLTNYALTMLIIFYLQQPPISILPSVEWLQRDRANDVFVDYWNTGIMNNPKFLPPNNNRSSISELLGGFFEFYSLFNFEEMVVCPYLGIPIRKELFKDLSSLPPEFGLYKKNVLCGYVLPLRCQTSFCVQDPFEQCHNVASTITTKLALDIQTFFKFVANIYEKEKLNNCNRFLKTILLEKPKLIRGKSHLEYRVPLFPRVINAIIDTDWKSVVRDLVITIFEKMMNIKLGKIEEKVNPDSKKEKEKYMGRVTKPIWRRKKYTTEMSFPSELSMEEQQSLITDELCQKEVKSISLQVQLIMTFCHDPKSAVLVVRMGGGDLEAFRDFGKFYISVMRIWFMELVKPYSMVNSQDMAAKIAEATDKTSDSKDDSDNDDDIELSPYPSPSPTEELEAEESRDKIDDAITNKSSEDCETSNIDSSAP